MIVYDYRFILLINTALHIYSSPPYRVSSQDSSLA